MGEFSIFHWLMALSVLAAIVAPIALASKDQTLARLPFFLRFLFLVIVAALLNLLVAATNSTAIFFTAFAAGTVLAVFGMMWAVHRVQDIGWPKWWCLLALVPALGLIFVLVLLLWPSTKRAFQ